MDCFGKLHKNKGRRELLGVAVSKIIYRSRLILGEYSRYFVEKKLVIRKYQLPANRADENPILHIPIVLRMLERSRY